ncbi:MAG: DUF6573 family protein [Desulfosalsimonadaceae bacterium]
MNPENAVHDLFGEVIYAYTRKQAIEDGQQVLLTGNHAVLARRAGWKYPIYLTSGVWDIVEQSVDAEEYHNDLTGVLWDIFSMARHGLDISQDTRIFTVTINGCGRKKQYQFYLQVGPTDIDDPAPAMTIMLPEDR